MVAHFYSDVQMLPQIPDQEMSTAMQQLSVSQMGEFDTISALKELYIYVTKYNAQVRLIFFYERDSSNFYFYL